MYRMHVAVQSATQAHHCAQTVHAAIPTEQDGRIGHCALYCRCACELLWVAHYIACVTD